MLTLLDPLLLDPDKASSNGRAEAGRDDLLCPRVWLSAVWFGAGLFAKETGMAMLAILPAIASIKLKDRVAGSQRLWRTAFPYGVVTAGYLVVRWAVIGRVRAATAAHSWANVVFSAPSILLFYLEKYFPRGTWAAPTSTLSGIAHYTLLAAVVYGRNWCCRYRVACDSLPVVFRPCRRSDRDPCAAGAGRDPDLPAGVHDE